MILRIAIPDELRAIAQDIESAGGKLFLVGGAVRDSLMGCDPKDWDCEAFHISLDELVQILTKYGKVELAGASFGVVKLFTASYDYDFSLPRIDSKIGKGHKGFKIKTDSNLTVKEAAARRDFTINTPSFDILTGKVSDPFGGINDLESRILKHTSKAFGEDPLRVLRGMQFAARFDMTADRDTLELCNSLKGEMIHLHKNRIWGEFQKLFAKGIRPSKGFEFLRDSGWLTLFPELDILRHVKQDKIFHPEGTVWQHTMLSVESAAGIATRENLDVESRVILLLSSLCHDMGKINQTSREGDRIKSHKHATDTQHADSFLDSIGTPKRIKAAVLALVVCHMNHLNPPSNKGVVRLANKLAKAGTSIRMLSFLVESDHSARKPLAGGMPESMGAWVAIARARGILDGQEVKPILMGRHLIELGMKPSPKFGEIIAESFQAQVQGAFSTESGAIQWARDRMSK